jgi:hypothetical protein
VKTCECEIPSVLWVFGYLELARGYPNLGYWFDELLVSFLSNPNLWVFCASVVL